jgi:type IV pilus assembly protein PilE
MMQPRPGERRFRSAGRAGFTLIEVMITVAIVAILAVVAYPSYMDQIRRGNRAEAKEALMEDAQFLERNYTVNNCYHRDDADCAEADNVTLPYAQSPATGTAKYNITVDYPADAPCSLGQCFTLSAAPAGTMTGDPCGTLTLTQAGAKGAGDYNGDGTAGDTDDVAACWHR